MIMLQNPFVLP
jgi:hypothetical protein